jgi:hypothetical protein
MLYAATLTLSFPFQCSEYYQNEITGTLCPELCAGNSIHSFKCLAEPKSDDKIFLAKKGELAIVLQVSINITYTSLDCMIIHFPLEC